MMNSYLQFYNGHIRWFFDLTKEYNELTGETEKDFSIEAFQKKPTEGYPNDKYSLHFLKKYGGLEKDCNGHNFFNLKTLLKWKQTMNRPKDYDDIELIKKLLSSQFGKGLKKKYSKKASKKTSKKASKKVSKKTLKK